MLVIDSTSRQCVCQVPNSPNYFAAATAAATACRRRLFNKATKASAVSHFTNGGTYTYTACLLSAAYLFRHYYYSCECVIVYVCQYTRAQRRRRQRPNRIINGAPSFISCRKRTINNEFSMVILSRSPPLSPTYFFHVSPVCVRMRAPLTIATLADGDSFKI